MSKEDSIQGIEPSALALKIHNTLVLPEATKEDIRAFCLESAKYKFGAVVVQGCWTKYAKDLLNGSGVPVSVGVGFPMGGSTVESKLADIRKAIEMGADMFEYMPNLGFLRSGMDDEYLDEIRLVVHEAKGHPVRAMLELAILSPDEKIRAAKLAEKGGVAGVKNSSGWGRGGPATVEDIKLLRSAVSPSVHVKASGGIRDLSRALELLAAGADYLGTRSGVSIIEELKQRQRSVYP
ncbi:MAG: deoxyribose-phosphate aldolase [Conexivisphaerales archaeon]